MSTKRILVAAGLLLVILVVVKIWPTKSKLEWHEAHGFRWADLHLAKKGKTGFTLLPGKKTGIHFANFLSEKLIIKNRHLLNGSGVTIGDVDGDGLADLYFCRLEGPNVLYKNLGNWHFKDITAAAGVAGPDQHSTGAVFADIDGDRDLDLLVTALGGPNACFLNDGTGKFADFSEASGIVSRTGATSLALADVDGDGDLDLYITNYKKRTVRDLYPAPQRTIDRTVKKVGNKYVVLPQFREHYTVRVRGNVLERFEYAEPDEFFLNDGKGHFTRIPITSGRFLDEEGHPILEPFTDWGLSVRFQDFDNDGDPDLYICNDFESPDRIWINDGTGRFRAIPRLALRNTSASSMGVDFSDIDRDGDMDFFVAEMLSRDYHRRKTQMGLVAPTPVSIGEIDNRPQYARNTFFINRGDNTYAEIAQYSGVQASEWSWSPLFLDVDLDGYEDLLIGTGHFYDAMDSDTRLKLKIMSPIEYNKLKSEVFAYPRLETPNFAFRNRGDWTFQDVSREWGFDSVDISHGMAAADLDNDGDLDVVINRLNAPALVYKNETPAPRIAVRLRGLPPNTHGVGAKIRVLGGPVPQSKEVTCGGTYLSGSDPIYVFAAGSPNARLTIEVQWRSGRYSVVEDAQANRIYEIYESGAQISTPVEASNHASQLPYFEDVSNLLDHTHHEDPYDDFKRQPLLPYRLSQLGPGVAWHDIDGDGDDDLMVGSGKGGNLAIFRNNGRRGFERVRHHYLNEKTPYDQTTVLGWSTKGGRTSLLVGVSNFESGSAEPSLLFRFDLTKGAVTSKRTFAVGKVSLGALAMADYDGDGDLDLFVGGRTVPGRYPEPASSKLYLNKQGQFELDVRNTPLFEKLGLVTGAVFSDIDADGDPDLILALEWGPITIFRNSEGRFVNDTEAWGLQGLKGRWNGVTTGDLNEDGRLDIIATNWGLNTRYHPSEGHPLTMYYNDFDNNGTLDIVEAYFEPLMNALVPVRGFSSIANAIPYVRHRVRTFQQFGEANLEDILGFRIKQAEKLVVNVLEHTLFLNLGDRFEPVALPAEAQLAPAFHVSVADFDGDGHDDVFMSQNFFAYPLGTSRSDAGRGLWLKGDGTGKLEAVPGQESGVMVYGEQRGAAVADFDGDARVDLVVTQNGARTKLYRNVRAKAGIRVRLVGPPQNPAGVGAVIRLLYDDGKGPAREIHAGSGYWSQDSVTQVLGLRGRPRAVWVRWPDGHITEKEIHGQTHDVTVNFDGA